MSAFNPKADTVQRRTHSNMNVSVGASILAIAQGEPIRQQRLISSVASLNEGMLMIVRQLVTASLLSFALTSLPVSAHAQGAGALAYCKEDVARLCKGIPPGGGKLIGCVKQHENEVSVGCAKELKAIKTKMGK